ncbi:MAG: F0F1 ATP synthase subunit alpha, partial [Clostridia bacterium]|nr:F0F1 ATP synthase subunit alpha [Clostridia bacterium]
GQIFLETELFHSGVIPAVNPGISVSRVGGSAQIKAMKKTASSLKLLYSQFRELEAFAQFGSDLDADTKARLALGRRIVEVLKQDKNKPVPVAYQVAIIFAVVNGYLNEIEVDNVRRYEEELFLFLRDNADELMKRIAETGQLPDEDRDELENAVKRFTEKFRGEVYGVFEGEK